MSQVDTLYVQFDQFMQTFLQLFTPVHQAYLQSNWQTFNTLLQTRPLDYNNIYTLINKMKIDDTYMQSEEQVQSNTRSSGANPSYVPSRANTITQNEERNQSCSKAAHQSQGKVGQNITVASSPRVISTVQKNHQTSQNSTSTCSVTGSNNLLNKFSQLDTLQSPKLVLSNLGSQQQLGQKNSLQVQIKQNALVEEFNRHLLLSKTKELLFALSVSTDKLNSMARLPLFTHQKENISLNPKSPLKAHPLNQQIQHLQSYQVLQQHQTINNNNTQLINFSYPLQNQVYQPMYVNGGIKPRGSNHSAEHYSVPQRAII